MNVGDIKINTAGSSEYEITYYNVSNPLKVIKLLENVAGGFKLVKKNK